MKPQRWKTLAHRDVVRDRWLRLRADRCELKPGVVLDPFYVMEEPDWVTDFADWMVTALEDQRTCDLLAYRTLAPHAVRNHPSEEHLLPLFVALGAAGPEAAARHLHASTTYGVLRMDAFAFESP